MPRSITFEQAKALYVDRYTAEHVPQWARRMAPNGKYYAPQYRSDLEWYNSTEFDGEGEIADKTHCYSTKATWPFGQWLDEPYRR